MLTAAFIVQVAEKSGRADSSGTTSEQCGTIESMTMNLRLSEEAELALAYQAKQQNISKTRVIEQLILEKRDRNSAAARFDMLARKTVDSSSDLMERLRDA